MKLPIYDVADYKIEFIHIDNENKIVETAGYARIRYSGTLQDFINSAIETMKNGKIKQWNIENICVRNALLDSGLSDK